jgi:hypothetical protein
MPSLTAKDRAPLCLFSYEDGRSCRTPRLTTHPHFCFYHAQKESQSQAAEKLSDDLAYFFSGDYLSANDLNTALARLIPATIRGEIKPRLARTVAYMLQTLLQSIHISQDEYINAFSTDGWRKAVRTSVKSNKDYLFPPDPQSTQSAPPPAEPPTQPNAAPTSTPAPTVCHPERNEGPCPNPTQPPTDETHHPPIPAPPANPTPNPAPTGRPTQTRDRYAVHFDHNYRLLVNGKPW